MQFTVRVKPGSRRGPLVEQDSSADGQLTVFVRERAVDGASNEGVVRALADHFAVAKSHVHILRGHSARIKRVEVDL